MLEKDCSPEAEGSVSAPVKRIFPGWFLIGAAITGQVLAGSDLETEPMPGLSPLQAVVFGIVEGVTEFLPISSTGHLLFTERVMGISSNDASGRAMDTYTIVIQVGAILAVAWVYHTYLKRILLGLLGKDPGGGILARNLVIAFLPAAVVGFLFIDLIKAVLFGLWPVTIAWFLGGVALMIWTRTPDTSPEDTSCCLETMSTKQALLIGLMQVISIWPGTSRSLVTIIGGKVAGLSLRDSVIFSFLLGLLTLTASTAYDLLRNGSHMIETLGLNSVLLGIAVAYASAWLSVRGLVEYLKQHGLGLFGGYRILLAVVTAVLLVTGVIQP